MKNQKKNKLLLLEELIKVDENNTLKKKIPIQIKMLLKHAEISN